MTGYITSLPAATALTGAELLEVSQLSTTVTISAGTISAIASDNSYNDSGNGFVAAGFAVGNRVKVTGFTGNVANNILVGTITVLTAGKMTIGGTDGDVIVDDAAGETVIISKWVSRRTTAAEIAAVAASPLPVGGSAGQVLTKLSGTDGDVDWQTPSVVVGETDLSRIGSLTKWNAAKARGASNPARFMFIGDSNIVGEGTGSGTRGLTGAAPTALPGKFATLASFQYQSFFGDGNITAFTAVALGTYDTRITLGTGWAPDTSPGTLGGRFLKAAAGSSGKLRFTPSGNVSKFRVWYPKESGLNTALTVSIDGSLVETFSQAGTASMNVKEYSVSSASHYIEIGGGATGTMYLSGIEAWDGSSSPVALVSGWCAGTSANLNGASSAYDHRPAAVSVAPDFAVLYCTINDAAASVAGNTYYANIEALVAALSVTANGCLCVGFPANNAGVTNGQYETYSRVLRNIAADYNWFFYDCRQDVGRSYLRANSAGKAYDGNHPNLTGSDGIAAGLHSFLSGAGL